MIHGAIINTENVVDAISIACAFFEEQGSAARLSEVDQEKLKLLIQNSDVNTMNQQGDTLLHIAAKSMEYRILSMLIDRNAIIQFDSNGLTPLDILHEGVKNETPNANEALDQFLLAMMNKIQAADRWDFLKEKIATLKLKYANEETQSFLEKQLLAADVSQVDRMILSAHKFPDPELYTDEEAELIDLNVNKFIEEQYSKVAMLNPFSIMPLVDRLFDCLEEPAKTFIPSGPKPNESVAEEETETDELTLAFRCLSL